MKSPAVAAGDHRPSQPSHAPRMPLARVFALLALTSVCLAAAHAGPPPAPAADARCPVCGMQVARHTAWVATIVFEGGKRVDFDGPKDMFRYYYDLAKYEKKLGPKDIREIWVTDYYTAKPIDARSAWFAIGSDVLGPMGHELVPLAGKKEAETFRKDHHARETLSFTGVTRTVVDGIE